MRPTTPALWATLLSLAASTPLPTSETPSLQRRYEDDFNCRSLAHPNPVILLHALFVTEDLDLHLLGHYLKDNGYCTFSKSYGLLIDNVPVLGGVDDIESSSKEIADFILEVKEKTGAAKVDLVGHSEGGFQALYVPKFREGIAPIVDRIVTMGSPTHGTTFNGITDFGKILDGAVRNFIETVFNQLGCPACHEVFVDSEPVRKLNDGKGIRQDGNTILMLATKYDRAVTPPVNAFVYETGVTNRFVQDRCKFDIVGHGTLAIDHNVWHEVRNFLDPTFALPRCELFPFT